MTYQIWGIILSSLFHGIIISSILSIGDIIPFQKKSIVIDFTLEKGYVSQRKSPEPEKKISDTIERQKSIRVTKRPIKGGPEINKKETTKPVVSDTKDNKIAEKAIEEKEFLQKTSEIPLPEKQIESDQSDLKANDERIDPHEIEDLRNRNGAPSLDEEVEATGERKGILETSYHGQGKGSLEKASEQYRKEHFNHIRETIQNNIIYPYIARKMSWEGKVVLSFVVNVDGSVKDIRIEKSSGFEILDNNAKETVRKSSPLPYPPVAAKIVLPVVYRLK